MVRDVTEEQRRRRPIFIATLWAGAGWLFFRVARSTRITQIWALRSRLEKQPTDLRQNTFYFGDRTLGVRRLALVRLGHLELQPFAGSVYVKRVARFDVAPQEFFSQRVLKEFFDGSAHRSRPVG